MVAEFTHEVTCFTVKLMQGNATENVWLCKRGRDENKPLHKYAIQYHPHTPGDGFKFRRFFF